MKESNISPDAHVILREYARGHHTTNDLSIKTANRVERSLVTLGYGKTRNYPAGLLTRQYSRNEVSHFPDKRIHDLRQPSSVKKNIIPWVSAQNETTRSEQESFFGSRKMFAAIRTILRDDLAESVGASSDEIRNGYIKRLLDKPEICDLLVQYYNESQLEKFREYIQKNTFFKLSTHRLQTSKNKSRHSKPATLGSYIARTFCPEDMSTIESQGKTDSSKMREVLSARLDLMRHLPIDPDAISDDLLVKVGLAPDDFEHYTEQARRRYKMAVAPEFLGLIAGAKMTERPHAVKARGVSKATARVIRFHGADSQEKIGIFATTSNLITERVKSGKKHKNRHHRISGTELRIFAGREEAIRSQEHAIEKMAENIKVYAELFNTLTKYHKKKDSEKKSYLKSIVDSYSEVFAKKTGFTSRIIYRYLMGSEKGKPTKSVTEQPALIGPMKETLHRGIAEMKGKINEIQQLKKQI